MAGAYDMAPIFKSSQVMQNSAMSPFVITDKHWRSMSRVTRTNESRTSEYARDSCGRVMYMISQHRQAAQICIHIYIHMYITRSGVRFLKYLNKSCTRYLSTGSQRPDIEMGI